MNHHFHHSHSSTDVLVDLVQPVFGPFVDLDLSYGLLNIQVQEPVNVNNTAWYDIASLGIDLTQVYLSQTTLSNDIAIGGGAYGQGVFLPDTADTKVMLRYWEESKVSPFGEWPGEILEKLSTSNFKSV